MTNLRRILTGFGRRLLARRLAADQRGSLMIETVLALTMFGMIGTAVLVGVNTTQQLGVRIKQDAVAERLARNQLEAIYNQSYAAQDDYYTPVAAPSGYAVTAQAVEYQPGNTKMQKVVVAVSRGGQTVLTVETLRRQK